MSATYGRELTAIVTGATSGIGLAVTELLAERGARVYLCARDARNVELTVQRLRQGLHRRRQSLRHRIA
ncbi:SDR family NAD(P)-dependent oxidoreductase [Nonomuraea polychroma]|uniref:SDR family NAD(P)-dependent oxidoreductase n=1 Tax=Nonomuraea polychroma TaxID=46176 RepID=UPI003D8A2852